MHAPDKKQTKRGVISVAKFKAMGDLVWQREGKTSATTESENTE